MSSAAGRVPVGTIERVGHLPGEGAWARLQRASELRVEAWLRDEETGEMALSGPQQDALLALLMESRGLDRVVALAPVDRWRAAVSAAMDQQGIPLPVNSGRHQH